MSHVCVSASELSLTALRTVTESSGSRPLLQGDDGGMRVVMSRPDGCEKQIEEWSLERGVQESQRASENNRMVGFAFVLFTLRVCPSFTHI